MMDEFKYREDLRTGFVRIPSLWRITVPNVSEEQFEAYVRKFIELLDKATKPKSEPTK